MSAVLDLPRVLVVDDEVRSQDAIRRTLDEDFTVLTASNADEARLLLERHEISVILCDQRMPGQTGVVFLKEVREGKANLDSKIKPIVENALSDRQLLRNLEYVRLLDDEMDRFRKSPPAFRGSAVGKQVEDSLKIARDLAIRQAGELALLRYQRNVDELNEHLRNGEKILIDITAAQRNLLDEKISKGQVSKAESKIYGVVKPDEEHVLWPFDGEYWRDELGFYRQVVESACGR